MGNHTGNKVTIVSADGHVSPPVPTVIKYFEPILRAHVDDLIRQDVSYIGNRATPARPPRKQFEVFDDRGLVAGGGEFGASDPKIRLQQMDAEGIAGDLLLPGTQVSITPFFFPVNAPCAPEIRAAGARAYHRWLADFISEGDGRLFGVAEPGPCVDMDETIAELEWCAANGFVSVAPPLNTNDRDLPPLYDPYYERFWAACADLGLVLNAHAGWGTDQTPMSTWVPAHKLGDGEETGGHDFEAIHKAMQEKDSPIRMFLQMPRRPLWQLMASGVFDRHPTLKLALTEIRADWVPDTIAHLEAKFQELQPPCARTPREYYADNILMVPSCPHRSEAEMRKEIGIEQFGFGQDFPHWEGTWPNTKPWLQHAFGDCTESELRAILGGNTMRFYGLPQAHLDAVADRIGFEVDEILGEHPVSDALLQQMNRRSGYLRSADPVYTDELDRMIEPDLRGASLAFAAGD